MSKQEVKEEARQQDIAPEIKGAIRRRGMQMSRQRMLAHGAVRRRRSITNPTHFAVALRYGRDVAAPQVVAKGAGPDRAADPRDRRPSTTSRSSRTRRWPARSTRRSRSARRSRAEFFSAVAEVLAFVYRTSPPQAVVGVI